MTKHKKKDKWALDPKKLSEEQQRELEREEKEFEQAVKEKQQ